MTDKNQIASQIQIPVPSLFNPCPQAVNGQLTIHLYCVRIINGQSYAARGKIEWEYLKQGSLL